MGERTADRCDSRSPRKLLVAVALAWMSVATFAAIYFVLWRSFLLRPNGAWGVASVVFCLGSMLAVLWLGTRRLFRGPRRMQATALLLLGVLPILAVATLVADTARRGTTREPFKANAMVRVTWFWLSSLADVEAYWRYPRRVSGRHVILRDQGTPKEADALVEAMDAHIETLCAAIDRPVPEMPMMWVRGRLLGHPGLSLLTWTICDAEGSPPELTPLDRHEMAHSVLTAYCGPDFDPPALLIEGWAEVWSTDPIAVAAELAVDKETGEAMDLEELVSPAWYRRHKSTVYRYGGPLVRYLLDTHGHEAFLRLYRETRQETFHSDVRRILGITWADVEVGFWRWVGEQKFPWPLAEGIDRKKWDTLVEGAFAASEAEDPAQSDQGNAYSIFWTSSTKKGDGTETVDVTTSAAALRRDSGWMIERAPSAPLYCKLEMFTPESAADLRRDPNGRIAGRVVDRSDDAFESIRRSLKARVEILRMLGSSKRWLDRLKLTLRYDPGQSIRVERIDAPAQGADEPWGIVASFELPDAIVDNQPNEKVRQRSRIEVSPNDQWRILSIESDNHDGSAVRFGYEPVDGGTLIRERRRWEWEDRKLTRTSISERRPMSDSEVQSLKDEVESVVHSGPIHAPSYATQAEPFWIVVSRWLDRAIVLCPILIIVFLLADRLVQRRQRDETGVA